jgi:mono/diheme cytochrome c family protein
MMIRVLLCAATLVLASCAAQPPATPPGPTDAQALAEDGREIAEAQCAGCHAVGPIGDSPNVAAPPFRRVLANYHSNVLKEELIAGIRVNHDMPQFQFNPQGVDALVAYLQSIQEQPAQTP